jgi:hypothetical protein
VSDEALCESYSKIANWGPPRSTSLIMPAYRSCAVGLPGIGDVGYLIVGTLPHRQNGSTTLKILYDPGHVT